MLTRVLSFRGEKLQTTFSFKAETQTENSEGEERCKTEGGRKIRREKGERRRIFSFIDLSFCIQHKVLLMEQEQPVTWEGGLEEEEEELA